MGSEKRDLIWTYYQHLKGAETARCSHASCVDNGPIGCPKHSTKGLKSHLKFCHKELYDQYVKNTEEKAKIEKQNAPPKPATSAAGPSRKRVTNQPAQDQRFITDTFAPKKVTPTRATAIDRAIAEMIALDMEPFAVVDREGFQRLMTLVEPGYQIRNRGYYGGTVMNRIYEGVKKGIKEILEKCETYSFTIDTWSDTAAGVELLRFVNPCFNL